MQDRIDTFRAGVVVPVYDHEVAVPMLVARLRELELLCWLVDDGSSPACAAVLDQLAAENAPWLRLVRLPENRGKGAAVLAGMRAAAAAGCTHAVQIDADCQHEARDIPKFIAAGRERPEAIINGVPVYDASVPKVRLYGREITNKLARVYAVSGEIGDAMCGFRLYPLGPTLRLDEAVGIGRRMQFDTDVIVRLHWAGVPVVNVPTPVTYPADGVSHFRYLVDNVRMVGLHLRLAGGMLWRLPMLIARRFTHAHPVRPDAQQY